MKKAVFRLSLSLVALTLSLAPALAAPGPSPAAPALNLSDQAFVASLAVQVGAPAPVDAARRPAIQPKSLCTASANCGGGVTVNCSSNTSVSSCSAADRNCNSEQGHVTCDGVTTWCSPACPACPDTWCTEDCDSQCYPCGWNLICRDVPYCTSRCKCDFIHCAP